MLAPEPAADPGGNRTSVCVAAKESRWGVLPLCAATCWGTGQQLTRAECVIAWSRQGSPGSCPDCVGVSTEKYVLFYYVTDNLIFFKFCFI